jgi:DMSO/TMAO reductase YedYZ molybdopterin-dependent catalytic subunit
VEGDRIAAELPPGQYEADGWPVRHYGRVPTYRPQTWDFRIFGDLAEPGDEGRWTLGDLQQLPQRELVADLHCASGFSVLGLRWGGVPVADLLATAAPAAGVSHVLVWAEYGYSASLRLEDLQHREALLALHIDDQPLPGDRGFPLRLVVPHLYSWKGPKWVRGIEYVREERPGFWEERGYHGTGEAWRGQRYAHRDG